MSLLRRWHEIAEQREQEMRDWFEANPQLINHDDYWFYMDTMQLNRKLQEIAVDRTNRFVRNRRIQ